MASRQGNARSAREARSEAVSSYIGKGIVTPGQGGGGIDFSDAHFMLVRTEDAAYKTMFDAWLGGQTDGTMRFFEDNAGTTTWAENIALIPGVMANLAQFPAGTIVDFAMPLATGTAANPAQSLQETIDGLHDDAIRAMGAAMAAYNAPFKPVRPGWESGYMYAYAHTATYDATRAALYKAAFRHVAQILKPMDSRIKMQFILQPQTLDYAGAIADWRTWYPGDDVVDIIGGDNYWVAPDLDTESGAEAFDIRMSQPLGLSGQYDFAMQHGKWFSVPEWGWSANKPDGYLAMIYWLRSRRVSHVGYWDKGLIGDPSGFDCRISNDQYPAVSTVAKREYGPVSVVTPASFSAPVGIFDSELEANKWGMKWSLVGGADAALFKVEDNRFKSLAPLAAGTYQITARATDERGKTGDRTHTITVTAGGHLPETMFYAARCTTAPDEAMLSAIDGVIASLKAAGVWWKTDCLYLRIANTADQTRINVRQSRYSLTPSGAPVFSALSGIKGDGAAASEDTGFLISMPGHNAGRDSFYIGSFLSTDLPNGSSPAYELGAGTAVYLMRAVNGQIRARPADFTEVAIAASGSVPGMVAMNRSAAAAWQGFAGDAQPTSGADASVRFLYETVKFLGNPGANQWGVNTHAADIIAASLTLTEHQAVNAALSAYANAFRSYVFDGSDRVIDGTSYVYN